MADMSDIILEAGIENVMFIVPTRPLRSVLGMINYTSSNDEAVPVPMIIDKDHRYKVEDHYKVHLVPIYEGFASESFYICDLKQLIRQGIVQMYIEKKMEW